MDDRGKPFTEQLSRREFAAVSTAAVVAGGATSACAEDTMAMEVEIKTADGNCDAVLIHPSGPGPWPAVLVWPDAFGLRPTFREMGARLATQGYVVLTVTSSIAPARRRRSTGRSTSRIRRSAAASPNCARR